MSWPEGGPVADHHFSATSQAGGQADQSHEVRHGARHRHRPQIQRLQAGRVTQENSSLIGTRVGSRPLITPRRRAGHASFTREASRLRRSASSPRQAVSPYTLRKYGAPGVGRVFGPSTWASAEGQEARAAQQGFAIYVRGNYRCRFPARGTTAALSEAFPDVRVAMNPATSSVRGSPIAFLKLKPTN
jgi:hypothetical protein